MSEHFITAAHGLVGRLLDDLPERRRHCAAVAARAQSFAVTVPQDAAAELVAAAWLHDIGYGSRLRDTGFHPIDGAQYLRREGWPKQVYDLVAHHSGSRFVAHLRGLDDRMREFDFVEDPVSDALTVADNTAGPGGTVMTVEERLHEKLQRHGPDSWTARANPQRDRHICAAARRVANRLVAVGQRDPSLSGFYDEVG